MTMDAKAIAMAYMKCIELHEASYDGEWAYIRDWRECAGEATADEDIAFIVYMACAGGYSDWHDWASEVLAR